MATFRRLLIPNGTYFFTLVTEDRYPWFNCEHNISQLRSAFYHVKEKRPFTIKAIVILPDHLHCIWQLPNQDTDYSNRWKDIKKRTSFLLSRELKVSNQHRIWQPRFWEHLIRNQSDYERHMDYIHYNPVKHGLVQTATDWQWSSLHRAIKQKHYTANWGSKTPSSINGMHYE